MLNNFVADFNQLELSIEVSVPARTTAMSLKQALDTYSAECVTHIDRLKAACASAVTEGELLLMSYLNMMIKDQSEELMRLKRLIVDLAMPSLDLRAFDKELHCKYKVLEKEKFNFESMNAY
jgi:hypothetical protein